MRRLAAITLTGLLLAGCSDQPDTVAPEAADLGAASELELAASLTSEVAQATRSDGGPENLVRRLIQGVRENGDDLAYRMLPRSPECCTRNELDGPQSLAAARAPCDEWYG